MQVKFKSSQSQMWILLSGILLISLFMAIGCGAKKIDDYGEIPKMRAYLENILAANGAQLRPVSRSFDNYKAKLNFLMRIMFGSKNLRIHMRSYQSPHLAVASFTQMENPPDSGYFMDLAYQLRPAAHIVAPLLHGDVIKPMPGIKGMFAVDFYNLNPEDLDVDEFLGDQLEKVKQALELVKPYQKTEEQGRGKLTPHLKPWKSQYRIELQEPEVDDKESHQAYFKTVNQSFQMVLDAYFTALGRLEEKGDAAVIKRNKQGHDKFIDTLDSEDIAARLSKWMFKDDYELFFMQGFWGRGEYGLPGADLSAQPEAAAEPAAETEPPAEPAAQPE